MEPKIQKGANWYGRQDEDDRVPERVVQNSAGAFALG